tara:strand:+ start:6880 stop:7551 length:672 start_codon:yes stop_codon:yes gene_type:complete
MGYSKVTVSASYSKSLSFGSRLAGFSSSFEEDDASEHFHQRAVVKAGTEAYLDLSSSGNGIPLPTSVIFANQGVGDLTIEWAQVVGEIANPGTNAEGTGFTLSSNSASNNDAQINDKTETASLLSVQAGDGIQVLGSATALNNRMYVSTSRAVSGDLIRITPMIASNDLNNPNITLRRIRNNVQKVGPGTALVISAGSGGILSSVPIGIKSTAGTTYEAFIVG